MDKVKEQALEAARILNSELFAEICDTLDADYLAAWRAAKTPEEREKWWYMQNALLSVKTRLFSTLQDAANAKNGKDEELTAAVKTAKEHKCRRSQKATK